jgi:hypothetical protein
MASPATFSSAPSGPADLAVTKALLLDPDVAGGASVVAMG